MKPIKSSNPPFFNLLCIGHRGVGKTVFLAGSYTELNTASEKDMEQKLWFECKNKEDKENLDSIVSYIAKSGQYPPPTMKITDFNFSLKQHGLGNAQTLCHFRWSDIPGEVCNFQNTEFQNMVLNSHSCCVFINGARLVSDPTYVDQLESLVKQVIAIATLIDKAVIDYAFALIFTQCDRLDAGPMARLQIEEHIQFLITSLEAADAKYQRFYSGIPIVGTEGNYTLEAQGSASAFLWLVSELQQKYQSAPQMNLGHALKPDISALQYWLSPSSSGQFSPSRTYPLWFAGIGLGLLGVAGAGLLAFQLWQSNVSSSPTSLREIRQYQWKLQENPNDVPTLIALADHYIQLGELEKAIPLAEEIVQQLPDVLDWQINLAKLYELTEQKPKAEQIYEQILQKDSNYYKALLGKAIIRSEQGDRTTAKSLFEKAEQAAPSPEIQQQIRETANKLLQ